MSKEEYLKGEKKLEAIQIIKTGLSVRMRPKEILQQLAKKGIEISERTYRRLKLEIYENSGKTVKEIFSNQVGGTLIDEILSYEEMERRCWEMFFEAKNHGDKLKALSLLRKTSQDKQKILQNFPMQLGRTEIEYTKIRDDLKEFDSEGDQSEKED